MSDVYYPNLENCSDKRPCFARENGKCRVLKSDDQGKFYDPVTHPCPFCKPNRSVTNGKTYPHRDALLKY